MGRETLMLATLLIGLGGVLLIRGRALHSLDFSKIEAGQLGIDPHPFDLTHLLGQVESLLSMAADTRGLAWRVQKPAELTGPWLGDAPRIKDGLTATREMRQNPAPRHLPVIALTAGVLAEEREAALEAGVDDFLAKPLDLESMIGILQTYVPSAKQRSSIGE